MSQVVVENFGKTKIRYSGIPLPVFPFVLREMQQEALIEAAHWWREQYGFLHFHASAFTRYGGLEDRVYERRWKNKKRRRLPTADSASPMVWKGNLRAAFLTGTMKTRATGTDTNSLKVTASWPSLPKYVYYDEYGKNRNPGPKMYFELTIMREDEEKRIAVRYEEILMKLLDEQSEAAA
jgi:hypothetical protein